MILLRNMKQKILVVDDEPDAVELLEVNLKGAGYEVVSAHDGEQALTKARMTLPDLIVLDLMLPEVDGMEVCKILRRDQKTAGIPIIMLTAKAAEIDRVLGLELGADDYVTKPFSPRELVARVRAVLRRRDRGVSDDQLRAGALTLDVPRMRLDVDGRAVELTATEFSLLAAMARQPGRVFTRSQLLDAIHGVAFESYERAIDAHVKNIRRKVEAEPHDPRYLLTVYGVGYRLADA